MRSESGSEPIQPTGEVRLLIRCGRSAAPTTASPARPIHSHRFLARTTKRTASGASAKTAK